MIFGAIGGTIMASAILISTFGCNNGLILSGARVYYAMAKDKLFFRKAGQLNKNHVPVAGADRSGDLDEPTLSHRNVRTAARLRDFRGALFYALTTVGLFILRPSGRTPSARIARSAIRCCQRCTSCSH